MHVLQPRKEGRKYNCQKLHMICMQTAVLIRQPWITKFAQTSCHHMDPVHNAQCISAVLS